MLETQVQLADISWREAMGKLADERESWTAKEVVNLALDGIANEPQLEDILDVPVIVAVVVNQASNGVAIACELSHSLICKQSDPVVRLKVLTYELAKVSQGADWTLEVPSSQDDEKGSAGRNVLGVRLCDRLADCCRSELKRQNVCNRLPLSVFENLKIIRSQSAHGVAIVVDYPHVYGHK